MNTSSLLWWMKHAIAMRKKFIAFGRGDVEFISSDNAKVISFIRKYQDEVVLVVINLSRFPQVAELDLSAYEGYVVDEVFGQNRFPVVGNRPYVLTLGSYDHFWFSLSKEEEPVRTGDLKRLVPQLKAGRRWETVFHEKIKEKLEEDVLPSYIAGCRWFGGKGRKIRDVGIIENIPVGNGDPAAHFLFLRVNYIDGASEMYLLPVAFSYGEEAEKLIDTNPGAILAILKVGDTDGIIHDAVYSEQFRLKLLRMIIKKSGAGGPDGQLVTYSGRFIRKFRREKTTPGSSQVMKSDQTNTSIIYGNELILKIYRKLDEGVNPDSEIVKFLSDTAGFKHVPPYAGVIEYRQHGVAPISIGHLQGFVPNQGDSWQYALDSISQFFERVLSAGTDIKDIPGCEQALLDISFQNIPAIIHELIGVFYLEMISLLGKRTGELHLALMNADDPAFSPEPYSMLYQRSVYQSMRNLTVRVLQLLKANIRKIPEHIRKEASEIASLEQSILDSFHRIMMKKISTVKMRYHGDYHLGQVLFTGNDFIIIDFEGEPARTITERRTKRSPLRDIAGMIRSFHYATYSALLSRASVRPEDVPVLEPWTNTWYCYVSGIFLSSYLKAVEHAPFIPQDREQLETMLETFLLEKAVYELGYELNNRPSWIILPIKGIKQILGKKGD
jgi:maltose alpha-D-glucosyltransferase/alpha-amylase